LMDGIGKIITVGIAPAWDVTCIGNNLEWGKHSVISEIISRPAGKALNISTALAWMGTKSIAAGLWGKQDYQKMFEQMQPLKKYVQVKMTPADAPTRQNITIVDAAQKKEMHLRIKSELASSKSLAKLQTDIKKLVSKNSLCIFAGSIPEKNLEGVAGVIKFCNRRGAKIVLDTSGRALKKIVNTGCVWLIKPNVEELRELVEENVKDNPASLAKAARTLLDKVDIVLLSRGSKGAMVVTNHGIWQGQCIEKRNVLSTVGCGDYLLAGFLYGVQKKTDFGFALRAAIKVAAAKAWQITQQISWAKAAHKIKTDIRLI
jgi:1-phosphofructokinase family hexose kinase